VKTKEDMVKLKITNRLIENLKSIEPKSIESLSNLDQILIKKCLDHHFRMEDENNLKVEANEPVEGEGINWIDHRSIQSIIESLNQSNVNQKEGTKTHYSFYEFMKSTDIYHHRPTQPGYKSSPEFQQVLSSIKLSLDQSLYKSMVLTTSTHTASSDFTLMRQELQDSRLILKSLSLILNILFSVFGFGYSVGWLCFKSYGSSWDSSLILGFFSGLVILIVEIILYWNYF